MNNDCTLNGRTILVVGGLCWGFALAHVESIADSTLFGLVAFSASTVFLIMYGRRLWLSESTAREIERRNQELESVRQAVEQHCLISMVDANRRFIYVNDSFLAATGYSREELLGQDPIEFQNDTRPGLPGEIQEYLTAGKHWTGEIKIRCKDGSSLWTHTTIYPRVDRSGKFLGSISIRTDISATKLAVAEREAMSILTKLHDNVYIFEPETYRFTFMNESAMRRHGWDRDTYLNKTVVDTDPNFDRNRFGYFVAPLLDGSAEEVFTKAHLADGPHEISVQLIRPESGAISFVAVFRNVSEKIEVERIKDEFISTVSHELRSPTTSIKGALGLLLSGAVAEIPPKAKNLVEIAHRNADRLVLLVNDILDLEKITAGRMEFDLQTSDLHELIVEAIEVNKEFGNRFDVGFRFDGLEEPAHATFDSLRMMQVLTNLLSNAAKFSKPGGEVVVSLHQESENYRIDVRDFGAGIAEEDLSKIFERFSQANNHTERSGKGTGLGLSIVKAIMKKHNGTVCVESKLGIGSTFSLGLPMAAAPSTESTQVA